MIDVAELEAELLAEPFPDGTFTIEPYEHWLCVDAVLSPPLPEGVAHPQYGYYVALTGMGMSIDELFARCHARAEDGPMFGEASIEWRRQMRVGETYTVKGRFVGVERKQSQRVGTMDLVTFELTVIDADGEVVAVSGNTFVYPRRAA